MALLLALALGGCASLAPDLGPVEEVAIGREAALASVNAFRRENGLEPVAIDERLMRAALAQSEAMASRDRMGHDVAGALPGRIERFGYRWRTTAENLGRNYADYDAAMRGWIGSPGHRRNLLNPNVTEMGFAAARLRAGGPRYWTQIFATPRPEPAATVSAGPPPGEVRWGPTLRFP